MTAQQQSQDVNPLLNRTKLNMKERNMKEFRNAVWKLFRELKADCWKDVEWQFYRLLQ